MSALGKAPLIIAIVALTLGGLAQYGIHTGHVASFKSLVRLTPYVARRLVDHVQHGGEAPPKPDIPPIVRDWYTPRPSDVIISPPAKSGTTWLLHMAHQLRMKGAEPTYDDQMDVTPWLESANWIGGGMSEFIKGEHMANPRVFKSHLPYSLLPHDVKLVVSFRDPGDCMASMYNFWNPMVDQMWTTPDQWATKCLLLGEVHADVETLVEWWQHRHDANVLVLFFKDMVKDHAGTVRKLAEFMGVDADEEVQAKVVEQSTKQWMSSEQWRHLFDEHRVAKRIREYRGLPPKDASLLTGKVSKKKLRLSDEHRAAADRAWKRIAEPATGFATFEDMRAAWKAEQAQ